MKIGMDGQISGPQIDVSEKLKQLKPPKENINKQNKKKKKHHQQYGIIIPPGSESNEYVKSIIESDSTQILLTIHIFFWHPLLNWQTYRSEEQ